MSLRFLRESKNESATPQPGSRWRPEENTKLITLFAWGNDWTAISDALLGRSKTSCMMHHHQTLAPRMRLGSNPIIQTYVQHRAQIWEGIEKELSVFADEAETMFLYLCRENPGMLQESRALPAIATRPKEERACRSARNESQIKRKTLVVEDQGEEMAWEME
ncbi:hypothetical protein GGR58DRAFT_380228 [Xylaria digitata]|nr:hypothetical protein GGR58DRAFT_380228 [Xylaria digitata]